MRSWPLALAVSLALLAGCGADDKKTTEPDPSNYLPQTSITNVIANLKTSYIEQNYEEYAKLLDASFTYHFAPWDVGGPNDIPETWGRDDDLTSASHMMGGAMNRDGYQADTIELTFTASADDTTRVDPDWRIVNLTNVHLNVLSRNEQSDYLIYMLDGDRADLYFVKTDQTAPGTDEKIWKIVRWDDKPIFMPETVSQSTTWGQVRAIWK